MINNDVLQEGMLTGGTLLQEFVQSNQFLSGLETAFGTDYETEKAETLQAMLANGTFLGELEMEVLPSSTLDGALGAYAGATNTIYLSSALGEFSLELATSVFLEEIGHAIDAFLNIADTPGDEGAIFASLVQGEVLSEEDLAQLREEDDSKSLEIDGETVVVEQREFVVTVAEDSREAGNLRSNIGLANFSPGPDTIIFDDSLAGATLTLTLGALEVTDSLTIEGFKDSPLIIDAGGNSGVFTIDDGDAENAIEVTINGLTITGGNNDGDGGGIFNNESLTLTNSTVSGNSAEFFRGGGGIRNYGTLNLINSTISGNSADTDGGGIYNSGTLNLINSTISGNSADDGGGIYNSGTLNLSNSIIANSLRGGDIFNRWGTVNLSGNNIVEGGWGGAFMIDPNLSPLQDNGGATLTHLPLEGSFAINSGDNRFLPTDSFDLDGDGNTSEPILFDSRGEEFERIVGHAVDIGAVEVQDQNEVPGDNLTVSLTEDSNVSGTLRSAIALANVTPGADTITFDPSLAGERIIISGRELRINDSLTIQGFEHEQLTINGGGNSRVFSIVDGDSENSIEVNLIGLTITGGNSLAGGGIVNAENLNLINSTISGNSADTDGGGIDNSGTLNLINSTISGNSADDDGGGIDNSGTLNLINSTISGNSADDDGGGIRDWWGTLNLSNSIIANSLSGGDVSLSSGSTVNLSGTNIVADGSLENTLNINPNLSPLEDHGGPTLTHLPLEGSVAIDFGDNSLVPTDTFDLDGDGDTTEPIPFDQRGEGFMRIFGDSVDLGAVEVSGNTPPVVVNPISNLLLNQGNRPTVIDLFNTFEDNEDADEELTYTIAENANPNIVETILDESLGELTLNPIQEAGETEITIQVEDSEGLTVSETFTVTLGGVNTAPVVENPINDFIINQGDEINRINLFNTFQDDLDDDANLTFTASSSNTSLVNTPINTPTGELVLLFPSQRTGTSEITVNAVDTSGLTTTETFTVTVNSGGQAVTFEEPNDTLETASNPELNANNPNINISGEIGDNDIDLYRFDLREGDNLTADINTDTNPVDSILRIFDASGNELDRNDDSDGSTDSFLEFTADTQQTYYVGVSGFGNANYNPTQENTPGKGDTGNYNLALTLTTSTTEDPTNDIISQAIEATSILAEEGQFTQQAFIGDNTELSNPNFDVDLYQIQLNQGETATLDLDTDSNSPLDLILRVFNATGGQVAGGFNNNAKAPGELLGSDPYLEFTAPFSGTYYVGVSDQPNDLYTPFTAETGEAPGATGGYTIEIIQEITEAELPTETNPNDTLETATAISLGNQIQGTIGDRTDFLTVPGLDVDLYNLSLEAEQEISISVNTTSRLDPILRFFNSEGVELAFNDDIGNSDNAFLELTIPATGDYYIGVSGFDNSKYNPTEDGSGAPFSSTGSYQLTVTEAGTPIIDADDEVENDTLATATATGLTPDNQGSLKQTDAIGNNPSLDPELDVDLFQVELSPETLLTVDINTDNFDSNLDSIIRIFNSEGNTIAFNDDETNQTNDAFLELIPDSAGTYYVGVSGVGNETYNPNTAGSGQTGSIGEYEVEIQVSAAIPEENPTNDTIENAILAELTNNRFTTQGFIGDNPNVTGDVDLYQVELSAEDILTLDVDAEIIGSGLDGFLRLFDSQGNLITQDDNSGDFSDPEITFTAPEDNTYYIGLSAFANREYNPNTGENTQAGSIGNYEISLEVETPVDEALLEEIRPTVNNDTGFTNSTDTITLEVLNNDTANDDTGVLEITNFSETTDKGGTVSIDANSRLVYTPDRNFAGVDTFTYTASNESGGSAQGTVEVTVNRPEGEANVRVILDIRPVPGKEDQLDDGLQIGDEFLVDVRFQDLLTDNAQGVTFGYADLLFNPNIVQVVTDDKEVDSEDGIVDGILRNAEYDLIRKGTVRNPQGLVDEVGGGTFASPDNPPTEDLVFSLHLEAVGGGETALFSSRAGEGRFSEITILGALSDQRDQTNFSEINLVEGVNQEEVVNALAVSLNNNPLTLQEQGIAGVEAAIDAMELSVEFQDDAGNVLTEVAVGETFNIVLSARDLRLDNPDAGDKLGVFSAFADLVYDTVLIDVTEANLSDPFESPVLSLDNIIDEGEGVVNELGGTNSSFNPVQETQEVAVLTATATAPGELKVSTNIPEGETAINTLFGVDVGLNNGTIYGGNTLTITGDTPPEKADLVVTGFDALIDHVLGGETEVSVTVENIGNGDASGLQVEVLYYTADNLEALATETPTVVETLALGELTAGESITQTQAVSLPLDKLLAEALDDDPSLFGEEVPDEGLPSNNVDFLGVRIVNSLSTNENEEAFGNNGVTGEEGVNVDDIAFFPWDVLNPDAEGVNLDEEDNLIADGVVKQVDFNAVLSSIGQVISQGVSESDLGLDLTRLDLDLDGAISPVDAVRVVNRIGYAINPDVVEN